MSTVLVLGARGQVGSALVPLLQAAGHTVRQASSQAQPAAGQVPVDLVSGRGLAEAMAGADAAFVMAPPGFVPQNALLDPAIDAARAAGVGKVVLMTALGANADEAIPMRQSERRLEASGLAWNVIRPNWFMQNFHTFWLQGLRQDGVLRLPLGSAKGSFIDVADIAAVAAALLTRRDLDNQAFDLTGPQALDHDAVVAILSRVTGRSLRYEDIAPDAMRQGLLGAGLPADYVEFMLVILDAFKAGHAAGLTDAVERITGRAPRRFEDYAQAHRAAWLA